MKMKDSMDRMEFDQGNLQEEAPRRVQRRKRPELKPIWFAAVAVVLLAVVLIAALTDTTAFDGLRRSVTYARAKKDETGCAQLYHYAADRTSCFASLDGSLAIVTNSQLRVRRQEAELELLTAVEEREFSFAQEVAPDGPPPEDVLMERTAARVEECRRVGSRLVLKGQAEVCVLYRGDNQELAAYRTALPFSQLLDGLDLPEGAETEARIQWASSEIRVLRTENGPAFGITVTVCAALLVRRKQQVSYIEDLYSLHHAAQVRRQETPLPVAWQRDIPSQEAVQQLEFGQGRPFAYLTAAECSGVSTVQEGGGPALRCTVRLRVLYLDESGTPVCAERSAEVTAPAAWEPQTVRAACGLPQMQITGSTCRLSVPVRFEARRCLRRPVAAVTAVELQDPPEGPQPSLILRRMAEGETLWDIARQYRTDEEAIRGANELTEDRPEGMLLIPRVR